MRGWCWRALPRWFEWEFFFLGSRIVRSMEKNGQMSVGCFFTCLRAWEERMDGECGKRTRGRGGILWGFFEGEEFVCIPFFICFRWEQRGACI